MLRVPVRLCIPWILLGSCLYTVVDTKRVLLLPLPFTSHVRQLAAIGDGLVDHGHEVYMVLSSSMPDRNSFEKGKIKILSHSTPKRDIYMMSDDEIAILIKDIFELRDIIGTWRTNVPEIENTCTNQLQDDEHYRKLKGLNFDLAIVDIFAESRSLLVLPYSLGVPYVGVTTMQEPWITRNPSLPSFSPSNLFAGAYTPNMNFWQRLNNLWMHIDWNAWPRVNYLEDEYIQRHIRDKPSTTLSSILGQCMLVLRDTDILLDYPQPLMPHEVNIGGLTTKPARPLPKDLEEFIEASTDGVILMTFGSNPWPLSPELVEQFLMAFREIKYNIIWKYVEKPKGLPNNVKVSSWLPQNDLLGHQKIKLFITHCGNNGQMEALYHGVPMVGYPNFGDQFYDCNRLSYHGFGICLDSANFKPSDMVNAVNEVMANSSYRMNIEKASEMFKDRPMTPKKRALYWIEHVMKYGGEHLHSHALDMPWYEYLMVDIAAFVFGILFLLFTICILIMYTASKALASPKGPNPKKQD